MALQNLLDFFKVFSGTMCVIAWLVIVDDCSREPKLCSGFRGKLHHGRVKCVFKKNSVQSRFEEVALFALVDELPEGLVVNGVLLVVHHGVCDVEKVLIGLLAPVKSL